MTSAILQQNTTIVVQILVKSKILNNFQLAESVMLGFDYSNINFNNTVVFMYQ